MVPLLGLCPVSNSNAVIMIQVHTPLLIKFSKCRLGVMFLLKATLHREGCFLATLVNRIQFAQADV